METAQFVTTSDNVFTLAWGGFGFFQSEEETKCFFENRLAQWTFSSCDRVHYPIGSAIAADIRLPGVLFHLWQRAEFHVASAGETQQTYIILLF